MQAEIITIGDEILIGQIVDTNSAWLGQHLNEIGIKVVRITSIQDNRDSILETVREAMENSDLVIVTGGLGPTKDDITKHTLAELFGCGLVRHEPTYEFLSRLMEERNLDFNELNKGQALVPECCEVLPNRNGTAPAMWFEHSGTVLVSMPGVPFEMKAIVTDELIPRLRQHYNLKAIVHKTAITFGIPESALAIRIAGWEESLPDYIRLAYLPNPNGIRLRLSAYEVDGDMGMAEIDEYFEKLENIIPDNFIGYGDTTLAGYVAGMMVSRNETLSVAESCTGGVLAATFTAMPGASEYFLGGVVAYSNDAKANILGVSADDIKQYGAVSRQVAEQMAQGVRHITNSTYGVATTGIAGPSGGSEEKPVGTVWIAIASAENVYAKLFNFGQLRQENIRRATANAINMLRNVITDTI